eukprot:3939029-Prymnesium_polylepis.1
MRLIYRPIPPGRHTDDLGSSSHLMTPSRSHSDVLDGPRRHDGCHRYSGFIAIACLHRRTRPGLGLSFGIL